MWNNHYLIKQISPMSTVMPTSMEFFWFYYFYLWHLILLTTLFSMTTFSWYSFFSVLFILVSFAGSSIYPFKVGDPQALSLALWFQLTHIYYRLWDLKLDDRLLSWTAGLCIHPPIRHTTCISFPQACQTQHIHGTHPLLCLPSISHLSS